MLGLQHDFYSISMFASSVTVLLLPMSTMSNMALQHWSCWMIFWATIHIGDIKPTARTDWPGVLLGPDV